MEQKDEKRRKLKNRIAGTAAGAVTAASLTVGALFGAPEELLNVENGGDEPEQQAAIVSVGKRLPSAAGASAQPSGLVSRLRAFLLRQSAAVRALVLLPLWGAGKAMLTGLSLLWTALSPVWQGVLGLLCNALLLFGLFALAYKLLFPNRSVKDLFKKKTFPWLLLGSLALAGTDVALRIFVPEYRPVSTGIKAGIGFLVLLVLCLKIFGKKRPAPVKQPA